MLNGVQIFIVDKSFEFTRNLSWSRSYHLFLRLPHLHFSTYWWSERERERERDANDEMKLWAIYKGLQIIGLFIWVDLTRPNNLDNIRSWTLGFLTLPKQYYQSIYIRGCKFLFYVAQKKKSTFFILHTYFYKIPFSTSSFI